MLKTIGVIKMIKAYIIIGFIGLSIIGFLKYQANELEKKLNTIQIAYTQNLETLNSQMKHRERLDKLLIENNKKINEFSNSIHKTKEYINETPNTDTVMLFNSTMDRLFAESSN